MPPNAAEVARPKSPLRGILPQSPLRIKQDGKFYERLLAKERSAASRSFRHYWAAEPGSVPFVWESQPGTPKVDVSRMVAGAVPAITPPPSYLLRHGGKAGARRRRRHAVVRRGRARRRQAARRGTGSSGSRSASSPASSGGSPSATCGGGRRRRSRSRRCQAGGSSPRRPRRRRRPNTSTTTRPRHRHRQGRTPSCPPGRARVRAFGCCDFADSEAGAATTVGRRSLSTSRVYTCVIMGD